MAATSVPGVLTHLRAQLGARPALRDVPVHIVDRGLWTETEAVVLSRVSMAGAAFHGWGAGQASLATREPLILSGYIFCELPGDTEKDAEVLARAGVLVTEVAQQLRDDPTVGGTLVPPVRLQPPLMDSQMWGAWPAEVNGQPIVRLRVDFTITWQAVT